MTMRLNLLGRRELLDQHGQPITLTSRSCFLLLAVLLSVGEIERGALAGTVWPESGSRPARNSLRNALSVLKSAIPGLELEVTDDRVAIDRAAISADWLTMASHLDYGGDFLPGFKQDWVIDQRLSLRAWAVASAVTDAEEAIRRNDLAAARDLLERGSTIDPLDEEVATLKVRCMETAGDRLGALTMADSHRASVLKEFGTVSAVRPAADPIATHPMLTAAEWILDRSPAEAISMLAATPSQWLAMPIQPAVDFHQRALHAYASDTSDRRMVAAQSVYLRALARAPGTDAEDAAPALVRAIADSEHALAARLAGALGYWALSEGEFRSAVRHTQCALSCAERTSQQPLVLEFRLQMGVILQHSGCAEHSAEIAESVSRDLDKGGSELLFASHLLYELVSLLEAKNFERAAKNLARARRIFSAHEAGRMLPWVSLGDSQLHEAVGDYCTAKASLLEVRAVGPQVGGQALMGMADDRLAMMDCHLGEYSEAAKTLAGAAAFRRKRGTVRSVYERAQMRPTVKKIKESLSEMDLRRAVALGSNAN